MARYQSLLQTHIRCRPRHRLTLSPVFTHQRRLRRSLTPSRISIPLLDRQTWTGMPLCKVRHQRKRKQTLGSLPTVPSHKTRHPTQRRLRCRLCLPIVHRLCSLSMNMGPVGWKGCPRSLARALFERPATNRHHLPQRHSRQLLASPLVHALVRPSHTSAKSHLVNQRLICRGFDRCIPLLTVESPTKVEAMDRVEAAQKNP